MARSVSRCSGHVSRPAAGCGRGAVGAAAGGAAQRGSPAAAAFARALAAAAAYRLAGDALLAPLALHALAATCAAFSSAEPASDPERATVIIE
mmetsp:Transcript_4063/g.14223  ORF Transcript_4063/g.14223 Transcript_4063/m.14223 type:complete len:93 (-) Transcript_4063:118-396(-)